MGAQAGVLPEGEVSVIVVVLEFFNRFEDFKGV
jgi:hypothetical protein